MRTSHPDLQSLSSQVRFALFLSFVVAKRWAVTWGFEIQTRSIHPTTKCNQVWDFIWPLWQSRTLCAHLLNESNTPTSIAMKVFDFDRLRRYAWLDCSWEWRFNPFESIEEKAGGSCRLFKDSECIDFHWISINLDYLYISWPVSVENWSFTVWKSCCLSDLLNVHMTDRFVLLLFEESSFYLLTFLWFP